jgi:hypothetical protein
VAEKTPERQKSHEISAIPAKDILKNKARVCPPLSAICEIMDNVFDNYDENGSRHDLAISFLIKTPGTGEISVAENSGGVSKAKLEPLVRLGVTYHANAKSIGTWGEGFKVAAFSLGSRVEVFSHFPGETPIVVSFGDDWLNSSDWNVPVYLAGSESPASGSTIFKIQNLSRKIDWSDIMRELSVVYSAQVASGIKLLRERPKSEKIFLDEITYFRLGASSPRAFSRSTGITVLNAVQKSEALDQILDHHKSSPVIVFCEFEATAEDIVNSITERPAFLMTGSVPVADRNSILAQFRSAETGVLVLTSVGAEGLDLQFCSALVNFDLTWNPMVLEQRIGRIDRIGQEKASIDIYNFVVGGSIDARIIKTLGRKLGLIEHSILEPRTVLASVDTRNFGGVEASEVELELDKARTVARAVELATQIIPDDYELANIIGDDACNLEYLRSLARSKSAADWIQELRSAIWLEKMTVDSSAFAAIVGQYAT